MPLTDKEQGYLMFLAFVLPAVTAWLAIGAPTDKAGFVILAQGIVGGIISYIKEVSGGVVAPAVAAVTTVAHVFQGAFRFLKVRLTYIKFRWI